MRIFGIFIFNVFISTLFAVLIGWPDLVIITVFCFGLSAMTYPLHKYVKSDALKMSLWWPYLI